MPFELAIALRYLLAKKRTRFVNLITLVSLLGVALGVTALVTVLAVMSGFDSELKRKILGNNSHIYLLSGYGSFSAAEAKEIESIALADRNVESLAPIVTQEAFILGQTRVNQGILIKGVDPRMNHALQLESVITAGSLAALESAEGYPSILIGESLAERLGFVLEDLVTVILPQADVSPFGLAPTVRRFRISGYFKTGLSEFDDRVIYASLPLVQRIAGIEDEIQFYEVRVKELDETPTTAARLRSALSEYPVVVRDWIMANGDFFSALQLEKLVMFIILTLIVVVAAFNILTTLILVVKEKFHDIAILKSFGATDRSILAIFLWQGAVIGTVGTTIGILLGLTVCWVLDHYVHYPLDPSIYMLDSLPVDVRWPDVFGVSAASIAISIIATLYPSLWASRLRPVDGLRWE